MIHDMTKKYIIARGLKLSCTIFFDTETEAEEYLQNTYMFPSQHRIVMFGDFV